jgi:hypothetical protein
MTEQEQSVFYICDGQLDYKKSGEIKGLTYCKIFRITVTFPGMKLAHILTTSAADP